MSCRVAPRFLPWRLLVAVLAAGALTGCHGDHTEEPVAQPTPLASYDGTATQVARRPVCAEIPKSVVRAAVGKAFTTAHYGNGDPVPGADDVSHEYGCVFTGEGGLVARTWTFVPPVTPEQAGQYAAAALSVAGCTPTPAAKFGASPTGTVCVAGAVTTVTFRGLFGDAWVTCSLEAPTPAPTPVPSPASPDATAPSASTSPAPPNPASLTDAELVERAGIWCVQVVEAAAS